MAVKIELAPEAAADIDDAFEYIARDSPTRARKWLNGLQKAVNSLAQSPGRCPLARESAAFGVPLRELLYGKRRGVYRILFMQSRETVFVVRVLHGARRFLDE